MDSAVFPADIMWHIIEYSENQPLCLMLVCHAFARNVKNYIPRQFYIRGNEHDMSICADGPIRNVLFIRCDGAHLRALNPQRLRICMSNVIDEHMFPLNRLTRLNMSGCKLITDDTLSRLTLLTKLNIKHCPQITFAGISTLTRVCNLVMNHNISIAHMPLIKLTVDDPPGRRLTEAITNTTLRHLVLWSCDAHGYNKLQLDKLAMFGSNPCNTYNTMTTITRLTIYDDDIVSDADIIGMNLVSLYLASCPKITDGSISTFTALQELSISTCNTFLGTCLLSLEHLRVLSCVIKAVPFPSDINHAISRMRMLTSLSITFTHINDSAISQLTNLTSLEMAHSSLVTNTGLRKLTMLRTLIIPKNPYVTDYGVSHLIMLTNLQAYKSPLLTAACIDKIYKYREIYTGSCGGKINTNIGGYVESDDSNEA